METGSTVSDPFWNSKTARRGLLRLLRFLEGGSPQAALCRSAAGQTPPPEARCLPASALPGAVRWVVPAAPWSCLLRSPRKSCGHSNDHNLPWSVCEGPDFAGPGAGPVGEPAAWWSRALVKPGGRGSGRPGARRGAVPGTPVAADKAVCVSEGLNSPARFGCSGRRGTPELAAAQRPASPASRPRSQVSKGRRHCGPTGAPGYVAGACFTPCRGELSSAGR